MVDGEVWNVSNSVNKKEIEEKGNHELFEEKENTI